MPFQKESAFGLDIGDASIKVLQIRGRKKYELTGFAEISLPPGIVLNGEIKEPLTLAGYIKTALKTAHISGKYVTGALPESKTFLKLLSIPFQKSPSLNLRIEAELQKHIPYELNEVWWDAVTLEEDHAFTKVLVGAAPRALVGTYNRALGEVGLTAVMLDLEPLAIARAVVRSSAAPAGGVIIVDLGATKSTIIVATPQTVITTADGRSAAGALTNQISQALGIEISTAENMKLQYGQTGGTKEYAAVVEDYSRALAERITAILSLSLTQKYCPAITEILLTGGGSLLKGLPETLTKHLTIPVHIADPWINTKDHFEKKVPFETAIRYTTACGLALSAAHYEHR